MSNTVYNYKKGLPAMAICYLIWGFQPLYFALDKNIDTTFLLACRIVWASVSCLIILAFQGKLGQLRAVFCDKKLLAKEIPAAFLLLADWGIYLFAVRMGRVMECSMGYYIMPLVMFFFGVVIFRERFRAVHIASLVLIVVGIAFSAEGFGSFPWVAILLSLCFAVYSALKKSLDVDGIVTTTAEILMMLPFALVYVAVFGTGESGLASMDALRHLFAVGSGIVTGAPMLFFAVGIEHLPLTLTGIFQYISPSLGIICSLILGESFTKEKLISFAFIWAGVILYTATQFSKKNAQEQKGNGNESDIMER